MTPGEHAFLPGRASILAIRRLPLKSSRERLQQKLSRQDAKHAKKDSLSFRPKGASFLDLSHSLGMTGLGPSPWRPLRLCASRRFSESVVQQFNLNFQISLIGLQTKNMVFQNQVDFKKRIGDEI